MHGEVNVASAVQVVLKLIEMVMTCAVQVVLQCLQYQHERARVCAIQALCAAHVSSQAAALTVGLACRSHPQIPPYWPAPHSIANPPTTAPANHTRTQPRKPTHQIVGHVNAGVEAGKIQDGDRLAVQPHGACKQQEETQEVAHGK
jgi:hypothetical protein